MGNKPFVGIAPVHEITALGFIEETLFAWQNRFAALQSDWQAHMIVQAVSDVTSPEYLKQKEFFDRFTDINTDICSHVFWLLTGNDLEIHDESELTPSQE